MPGIAKNRTLEPLVSLDRHGRLTPMLAESLEMDSDGSLRIHLRPNVTFHDGTLVTSDVIASVVRHRLPEMLGPAASDVAEISAVGEREIQIRQSRPSPFLSESLDFVIEKPDAPGVGTGPFSMAGHDNSGIELKANDRYYLGAPAIKRILLRSYPTVRAAWADMLRDKVDVLYEVGVDALDSLQSSSQVSVYPYQRPFAYVIVLNAQSKITRAPAVRVALNQAIDRAALIPGALYNHGTPAVGPVWPQHWAYNPSFPAFQYDPTAAARVLGPKITFKCIFAGGMVYERLALAVQRQLAAFGVDMQPQETSIDELVRRVTQSHDFEAVLFDAQLAPNLFRSYQWWHSRGPNNFGQFHSAKVDAALDVIRYAKNDQEYATGTLAFQKAMIDNPPAIFLAWGERVRAVSHRFEVPHEPGQDILDTLRLWKAAPEQRAANRN